MTTIFPKGEKGSKDFFTGNAYPTALVDADSMYQTLVGNVYFESGARSNWHSHPAGQILIITDGIGYHQIEGKPIEIIKKDDDIKCPPNVKHCTEQLQMWVCNNYISFQIPKKAL